MSHRSPHKLNARYAVRSGAFGLVLLASVMLVTSSTAKADELEDMLVRLSAAAANGSQPNTNSLVNIVGADGIHGAIVTGSANGSQGIMALNQDAGPGGATQANVVVIALSNGPNAAAIARLLAEQVYSEEGTSNLPPITGLAGLAALAIVDSYKGGSGIAQVNQSAGQGNVQRNATLIAAALGGSDAFALSEADLSALGAINRTIGPMSGQRGIASVSGSFTDFTGIVQVNQTIGTGNIVANTVSITYAGGPAGGGS